MLLSAKDMILLAMDMDMLQLPMGDMLLSAMDMDRPLLELYMTDTLLPIRGHASFNLNSSTMSRI